MHGATAYAIVSTSWWKKQEWLLLNYKPKATIKSAKQRECQNRFQKLNVDDRSPVCSYDLG